MTAPSSGAPGPSEPQPGHPRGASATDLLQEAKSALAAAGVPSPDWDAERLLRHVLGWDRATLLTHPDTGIGENLAARVRDLVRLRASRVPLQHLTGTQAFWRHDFLVTRDVLIPRPETELLVDLSLQRLEGHPRPALVDVGTGSGCIVLSLASELPTAELHATDISAAALVVARTNARRLGLQRRVTFHRGDLLGPIITLSRQVDLVVSNPPYVDPVERQRLAPEVLHYEPPTALFALEPFPDIYARLARGAARVLRPGGALIVEIGLDQATAVAQALAGAGLDVAETRRDLGGIPRAVVALRTRC